MGDAGSVRKTVQDEPALPTPRGRKCQRRLDDAIDGMIDLERKRLRRDFASFLVPLASVGKLALRVRMKPKRFHPRRKSKPANVARSILPAQQLENPGDVPPLRGAVADGDADRVPVAQLRVRHEQLAARIHALEGGHRLVI